MGPLEGVRIIDFTQFMAGPLATQLLGDLGCDVIKVERPGVGDAARQGSASPFTIEGERNAFVALNGNKRSVTIDLKHPDGRAIAQRLCEDADVVIENFRPRVMARLGLAMRRCANAILGSSTARSPDMATPAHAQSSPGRTCSFSA